MLQKRSASIGGADSSSSPLFAAIFEEWHSHGLELENLLLACIKNAVLKDGQKGLERGELSDQTQLNSSWLMQQNSCQELQKEKYLLMYLVPTSFEVKNQGSNISEHKERRKLLSPCAFAAEKGNIEKILVATGPEGALRKRENNHPEASYQLKCPALSKAQGEHRNPWRRKTVQAQTMCVDWKAR